MRLSPYHQTQRTSTEHPTRPSTNPATSTKTPSSQRLIEPTNALPYRTPCLTPPYSCLCHCSVPMSAGNGLQHCPDTKPPGKRKLPSLVAHTHPTLHAALVACSAAQRAERCAGQPCCSTFRSHRQLSLTSIHLQSACRADDRPPFGGNITVLLLSKTPMFLVLTD